MYLDLRNVAKQQSRPTSELINLYALEGFLDRLGQVNKTLEILGFSIDLRWKIGRG